MEVRQVAAMQVRDLYAAKSRGWYAFFPSVARAMAHQGRAMESGNIMPGSSLRRSVLALVVIVGALAPTASNALPTELLPRWSALYGYTPTPATPPSVGVHSDSRVRALAIAVSPDGRRAYVTGTAGNDYASVAYDTTNGAELWVARLPGSSGWGAADIAVSPDGTRAYVTGQTQAFSYTSVAYDASTGTQLWTARYDDASDYWEHWGPAPQRLAVSPEGTRVYVATGSGTVAYDAADGSQLWLAPVAGGSERLDVSPDGARVYVSGELSTVALAAVDGSQIWVAPGTGRGGDFAMSPDGARLYVVDPSYGPTRMTTSSYDAADGSLRWSFDAYNPGFPDEGIPREAALAVGPLRGVFVTAAAATLAFDDQGSLIWLARNSLRGTSRTLSVSPDGLVYVSGSCSCEIGGAYPTPAYRHSASALVAYDYFGNDVSTTPFEAEWSDVALSSDGSRLFATGRIAQQASGAIQAHSYATVAFCAGIDRALLPLDLVIPSPPACLPDL